MTANRYKIGLVQARFAYGEVSRNLEKMKRIAESCRAAHGDVKLLLFPELAATGYFLSSSGLSHCAEERNGEIAAYMSEVARENDMYIGYGYAERGPYGELFNSLRLIDRHGQRIANYRKIHITELERGIFTAGNEIVSVQTELGHIGLMICWDLAFPELARTLTLRGAELILSPSAWERPHDHAFQRFGMARAIDNTVYVAACNSIGQSDNLHFFGKSTLFDPRGTSIAWADDEEEIVVTGEIDREYRKEVQNSFFTMLKERRKELYGLKEEGV
jgi:predicted amidohydrolase